MGRWGDGEIFIKGNYADIILQSSTLAYWPRFANNLQPSNLGLLATLREQPSTV
ncbi:MAG: hypothetical protein F6J94_07345 [Moorea sp. SIO1F2]|uniref:hypothetical protein n=1 Tax=unclassified Moorena TaxID=2683338 RepID=UPI0013B66D93|nr:MULTISPECIES: hypothetical protein [unclassified Moorena]NEO05837.1 hypothetical protein [Moorena sp. SIO3I8]NET81775.1 hypothetical protein [Moorena sp. SIO1F2]